MEASAPTAPSAMAVCWSRDLRELAPASGPATLLFAFEEGLGGAWTERDAETEVIRFGYPPNARSAKLRVLELPSNGTHNAATLAIERIVFARRLRTVGVWDERLMPIVKRGLERHPHVIAISREPNETPQQFSNRLAEAAEAVPR